MSESTGPDYRTAGGSFISFWVVNEYTPVRAVCIGCDASSSNRSEARQWAQRHAETCHAPHPPSIWHRTA